MQHRRETLGQGIPGQREDYDAGGDEPPTVVGIDGCFGVEQRRSYDHLARSHRFARHDLEGTTQEAIPKGRQLSDPLEAPCVTSRCTSARRRWDGERRGLPRNRNITEPTALTAAMDASGSV